MSSAIPRLNVLAGDIRLVKFTGAPDTKTDEPLSFERTVVSLNDTNNEYRRFSKARPKNISPSQIFENWISRSYDHGKIHRQKHPKSKSFDSADFKPRYQWGDFIAISYTWGDKRNLKEIRLDEKAFQISHNLEEALRASLKVCQAHICRNLYFWNDVMCVNQGDKEEIDLALKQFSNIFSMAYAVHFWIGKEADKSTRVMELAHTIDNNWESLKSGRMAANLRQSGLLNTLQFKSEILEARSPIFAEKQVWPALANFLARPYWKRLWIVQELALANATSLVMCGEQATSLVSFWRLVRLLNGQRDLLQLFFAECQQQGWSREAVQDAQRTLARLRYIADLSWTSQKNRPSDLGRLVKVSRESQQEREQDKVYGLMGLILPTVLSQLHIDSAKTPETVYSDFTKAYIQATGSTDILKYCGSPDNPEVGGNCSWAVNLLGRRVSASSLDNGIPFHAGGCNPASFEFYDEGLFLIRGFIIDRVKSTTISCTSVPMPGSSDLEETDDDLTLNRRYGSTSELKEAIWRTLVADRAYHSFSASSKSCKVLLEVPWTLALTSTKSEQHAQLAESLSLWADNLNQFREKTADFDLFGHTLGSLFPTNSATDTDWLLVHQALLQMSRTLELRRLMTTSEGRLGICPEAATCGDVVAIFPGCNEPIILRELENQESGSSVYQVIGSSYVDGVMEGQVPRSDQYELKDILLR